MEENSLENESGFDTAGVVLVSSAHAVHDTYSAFLPALLPVLIEKFTLTNTSAGLLSLFHQLPSLLQPVIGHLADRHNLRLLIVLAPVITGTAMSLVIRSSSYNFLIFLMILSGLSSASLHAVGPVVDCALSGKRLGKGMSFWMVGGELGRTLGPVMIVSALAYLSQASIPWLMLGGLITSVFLWFKLAGLRTQANVSQEKIAVKPLLKRMGKILLPITMLTFSRSLMVAALTTFLPTFMTSEGSSLWAAGASLTILQAASVVGALIAGTLSDRFGRRKLITVSYLVTPVFMFIFLRMKGAFQVPFLVLIGLFGISITPVLMTVILENFPENRSFMNGVYMAINFGLTALAIMMVGKLADLVNLRSTFLLSALLIPVGLPFILMLPKVNKQAVK